MISCASELGVGLWRTSAPPGEGLTALRLACVDDDAQGEVVEVLWDAELDGSVLKEEGWASVAKREFPPGIWSTAWARLLTAANPPHRKKLRRKIPTDDVQTAEEASMAVTYYVPHSPDTL